MVATRYSVRVFGGLLASVREFWYSRVIRRHILNVGQQKMKNSQASNASWFCILLLFAVYGLLQLKGLVNLCYDHFRSQAWESVEGLVTDQFSVTNDTYTHSSRYGQTSYSSWVSSSSYTVTYTWQNYDETLHVPTSFMTSPGDLIDIAYSDDVYPEIVVRYRNFNHRLAWKCIWMLILLVVPFCVYRAISRTKPNKTLHPMASS